MPAAFPVNLADAGHAQVRLVDQFGRLQRVGVGFAFQVVCRQTAQILIDKRGNPLNRFLVAIPPQLQPLRDVVASSHFGAHLVDRIGAF